MDDGALRILGIALLIGWGYILYVSVKFYCHSRKSELYIPEKYNLALLTAYLVISTVFYYAPDEDGVHTPFIVCIAVTVASLWLPTLITGIGYWNIFRAQQQAPVIAQSNPTPPQYQQPQYQEAKSNPTYHTPHTTIIDGDILSSHTQHVNHDAEDSFFSI